MSCHSTCEQRWSSEISATLPEGKMGEGEGRAAPTLVATTPCRVAAKVWTAATRSPVLTTPVMEVHPCVSRCPLGWPTPLELE